MLANSAAADQAWEGAYPEMPENLREDKEDSATQIVISPFSLDLEQPRVFGDPASHLDCTKPLCIYCHQLQTCDAGCKEDGGGIILPPALCKRVGWPVGSNPTCGPVGTILQTVDDVPAKSADDANLLCAVNHEASHFKDLCYRQKPPANPDEWIDFSATTEHTAYEETVRCLSARYAFHCGNVSPSQKWSPAECGKLTSKINLYHGAVDFHQCRKDTHAQKLTPCPQCKKECVKHCTRDDFQCASDCGHLENVYCTYWPPDGTAVSASVLRTEPLEDKAPINRNVQTQR